MKLGVLDIIFINALMLRYFNLIDYSYLYIFLWWIGSAILGAIIKLIIEEIFS